jgi:hypothetical protein
VICLRTASEDCASGKTVSGAQFSQPDGNLNDGGNFGKVTSLRYASEREIQLSFRVSF